MATGVNPFPATSYNKAPDSQSLLFTSQRKKKTWLYPNRILMSVTGRAYEARGSDTGASFVCCVWRTEEDYKKSQKIIWLLGKMPVCSTLRGHSSHIRVLIVKKCYHWMKIASTRETFNV